MTDSLAPEPRDTDVAATEPVEEAPVEEAPSEPDVQEALAEPDVQEPVEEAPSEPDVQEPVEEAPADPDALEPPPASRSSAPVPSPALFARSAAMPAAAAFGRVDESGVVYVRTDAGEREVGSYPGASSREALAYFARKYDEVASAVELLHQRVSQTDMAAKDASEAVARLREQVGQARVVGDLAALGARLDAVDDAVAARRVEEAKQRAAAKAEAASQREQIVSEAERIAAQPEASMQWKSSGARLRELLDEWKAHQRSGPRLDKELQAQLWHRFSAARNSFDKARRTHFAQLDTAHAEAKATKERLVAEAERLATSRDWAATAGAFKRLMDDWRHAGRASRGDDDLLWERFKAAQDGFFAAKGEIVAAEDASWRKNLAVKQGLLAEADALVPVTDLDQAKAALRVIQDKWDRAGKVPRADLERTEKALRRVEQAVRDAEQRRWSSSNPEAAARAQSLVDQLERAVAELQTRLAQAQATGNAAKVADAQAALDARREWLHQARAGVEEFGPRT
ncbi:MAG: DUF349 domain-containing protein [Dermatophilaceae bacterium]